MGRRITQWPRARRSRGKRRSHQRSRPSVVVLKLLLVATVALGAYLFYLDATILAKFEGKRWALPAHVYARPMELFPGISLTPQTLEEELRALGYRASSRLDGPGQFDRHGQTLEIVTRGFAFWDGYAPSNHIAAVFAGRRLRALKDYSTQQPLGTVRLEPLRIGGIYPTDGEDRVLVRLKDVPTLLIQALMHMEDRNFLHHPGISVRGIGRALWANLRAGKVVQGGSTLTQQLVKNYFLSSERSLWRKIQEAMMALLLEIHFSKEEILEAYINEIHLGQDGNRAIHGFGLASQFYFAQPLEELAPEQLTLLAALVRGPSYYNPRRHPERAKTRRNRVLETLTRQGVVAAQTAQAWQAEPLGITAHPPGGTARYPAFIDLVRRQLARDYRDEDLATEGLRIITTLDPRVQRAAERALIDNLTVLEQHRDLPTGSLEGAVVVTGAEDGEVLAVIGGRDVRFAGFNRALDAVRPVGSLIKPAVYLTALASGDYTLATPLEDTPLHLESKNGSVWTPENYDRQAHGRVPLYQALAQSYNLATARLGLSLGIRQVLRTLHELGIERTTSQYPSLLLGAVNLSAVEVAQMYQTLAATGFYTPLRAIRDVYTADGTPLARYPLQVRQVTTPEVAYLMTAGLQEVVRSGTARGLGRFLSPDVAPAGKTGTTDKLRDSWFAGYTGDYLAVVWLGRDDNQPTGLTGAQGALRVWGDMMRALNAEPLQPVRPPDIEYAWVDNKGHLSAPQCTDAVHLPFERGNAPQQSSRCAEQAADRANRGFFDWARRLFQ